MLPFLDPDGEPSHFDSLHILDFVQVGIFWVVDLPILLPEDVVAGNCFSLRPLHLVTKQLF